MILKIIKIKLYISIHAPARGATEYFVAGTKTDKISIHAPARGATLVKLRQKPLYLLFQSTLPRGERLRMPGSFSFHLHFNPRSREGSDSLHTRPFFFTDNFNPRSREGSDPQDFVCPLVKFISIHAPARGATFSDDVPVGIFPISIHAPARGATNHNAEKHGLFRFQSTLPRGERRTDGHF